MQKAVTDSQQPLTKVLNQIMNLQNFLMKVSVTPAGEVKTEVIPLKEILKSPDSRQMEQESKPVSPLLAAWFSPEELELILSDRGQRNNWPCCRSRNNRLPYTRNPNVNETPGTTQPEALALDQEQDGTTPQATDPNAETRSQVNRERDYF